MTRPRRYAISGGGCRRVPWWPGWPCWAPRSQPVRRPWPGPWCPAPTRDPTTPSTACPASRRPRAQPSARTSPTGASSRPLSGGGVWGVWGGDRRETLRRWGGVSLGSPPATGTQCPFPVVPPACCFCTYPPEPFPTTLSGSPWGEWSGTAEAPPTDPSRRQTGQRARPQGAQCPHAGLPRCAGSMRWLWGVI
jgi:hypothetical protein